MKKVKFLALMFLAGSTMFTSCKKDETTMAEPTISFANGISNYEISATATYPWSQTITPTITAEGEIKTFTVKKKDASGASSTVAITGSFSGKTSFTETFTIVCAATDSYPLQIIFNVTDKEDMGIEKIFTITQAGAAGTTLAYENTSAILYNLQGPTGYKGAWDLVANVAKASADASADKDMKNTTPNPPTGTYGFTVEWVAMNSTMFVSASSLTYATATLEDITAAYAAGTPTATVTTPTVNSLYVAKLRGGSNYALIKVTAINTTTSDNLDNITFSYKKLAQ